MDTASIFSVYLSSPSFIALVFTAICCLFAFLAIQLKLKSVESDSRAGGSSKEDCNCACMCKTGGGGDSNSAYLNGGSDSRGGEMLVAVPERQSGASMMEQLVPEITTHALSYLDYPSLCRLSMTNSLMRKAANDDNAWKALYHKDFTLEQDNITPANGWKAYYAATRAIVNVNAEFFNITRQKSLLAMGRLWLNADYVKCVHASGELFTGYNAVIESFRLAFNWDEGVDFQVRDVRARILADMAWVSMKTFINGHGGSFNMTNVFEFHNDRWFLVHHHSSLMLLDGEGEQQIVLG